MNNWIRNHGALVLTVALNLLLIGAGYGKFSTTLQTQSTEIQALKDQRADQTRWQVDQHEKRLNDQQASLEKLIDRLNSIDTKIDRIALWCEEQKGKK